MYAGGDRYSYRMYPLRYHMRAESRHLLSQHAQNRFSLFDHDSFDTAFRMTTHIPTARPASGGVAGEVGTVAREMPRDTRFLN